MNLWDESEIEIINGDKYLNEEASQRVYEKYEKYLSKYKDSKFRKFRVESVSKLIEYFSSLQHDDTSKDLETDEKKLLEAFENTIVKPNDRDSKKLFSFFTTIPQILNRKMSTDEIKKYIKMIDKDFNYYETFFDLYIDIINNGLNDCIKKCNNQVEILMYLETYKNCLDIQYNLDIKMIYELFSTFSKDERERQTLIKDFLDKLKKYNSKYYSADKIISSFNEFLLNEEKEKELQDLDEDEVNLLEYYDKNYKENTNMDFTFLLNLSSILNKTEGIDFQTLIKYGILLSEKFDNFKFGKKEQTQFSLYLKLSSKLNSDENKIIDFSELLNDINSLDDLLIYLEFFKKYKFPVKQLNLMDIDNWLKKNNFYEDKKNIEDFYEQIEEEPEKYYYGNSIVSYFGEKIYKPLNQNDFLVEEEEKFTILNRFKPVTDKKKKQIVEACLASVGIISCLYMTLVLKYDPVTVISNCVSTFKRFFVGNGKFNELLSKLGNLTVYFASIVGSYVFTKKAVNEYKVEDNEEDKQNSIH